MLIFIEVNIVQHKRKTGKSNYKSENGKELKSLKLCVAYIYILDTYRRNDNRRSNKRRKKDFFNNILTSHFICKVWKGLLKVCMWEDAGDRT